MTQDVKILNSERILLPIPKCVKKAARSAATAEGKTLSAYLRGLIVSDLTARNQSIVLTTNIL